MSKTEYMREYRKRVAQRQYAASKKNWWLQKLYGITYEQYKEMLDNQGGACAICKSTCSTGKDLAVDHNAKTNKVRALLCMRCNRALGTYEAFKEQAEGYLEKYDEI